MEETRIENAASSGEAPASRRPGAIARIKGAARRLATGLGLVRRNGLVLEGGGMRGLFTAGVLDAWAEDGIRFDGIIAVSAGACFGCNFKSGQPGRALRYNKRFARDPRYCSLRSLLRTGDMFNADFCYRELPENLDPFDAEAFAKDPAEFHVVATDVETGEAVARRLDTADGAAFSWIRASASMPVVSRPVEIDGRRYLDGGLSDAIPLRRFEEMGFERNVVISTRPRGYRKGPMRTLPLFKMFLRGLPAVYTALKERHERYNEALDHVQAREEEGAALLVAPPEALPVSRVSHDPDAMQRAYDIGFETGGSAVAAVRKFLA